MAVFRLCQLEKSGHNWGVNSLILALWKEAKLTRMGRWHAFQGTCGHHGAYTWRRGPYAKMLVTFGARHSTRLLWLLHRLPQGRRGQGLSADQGTALSADRGAALLAAELLLLAMLISWCAACTAGSKESQQGGHGSHFQRSLVSGGSGESHCTGKETARCTQLPLGATVLEAAQPLPPSCLHLRGILGCLLSSRQ